MEGSRSVVILRFLLSDEMVDLFAFTHGGKWEGSVGGVLLWEGYCTLRRKFRGDGRTKDNDGILFTPPPPHPSLSGDIKTQTPLTITPALFYLYPTMKTTKTAGGRDVRYPREIFGGG